MAILFSRNPPDSHDPELLLHIAALQLLEGVPLVSRPDFQPCGQWIRQLQDGVPAPGPELGAFQGAFIVSGCSGSTTRSRSSRFSEVPHPGGGVEQGQLAVARQQLGEQPRCPAVVAIPVAEAEAMPFEVCEHLGGGWIEGQGGVEFGNAGLGVAQGRQGLAELVVALAQLRLLAQQAAEAGHGGLHPAQLHQGGAELQQQIGALRRGPQDDPQGLEGLVGAPQAAQLQGEGEEVVASDGQAWVKPEGLAVGGGGGVEIALELQEGAAVGEGSGRFEQCPQLRRSGFAGLVQFAPF